MSDHELEQLLARERGEAVDGDLAAYDRITDAIGRRGAAARAPADFDRKLWQAIDAPAPPRRRTAVVAAGVALAVAAAAVAAVWLGRGRGESEAPRLALAIERGDGPVRRSDEARPGDRLAVTARDDAAHVALWLYRDDAVLVEACSDAPPCARAGGAVRARLPLERAGVYQLVVVRGTAPLPPPTGDLDADTAAALDVGAVIDTRRVEVR